MSQRLILCAPVPVDAATLVERLNATDWSALFHATETHLDGSDFRFEFEWRGADPTLAAAFEAAAVRHRPTLSDRELAAIVTHTGVLYATGPTPATEEEALQAATQGQMVAAALLDAGALGVKCETSGIAHGLEGWTQLLQRTREAMQERHQGDENAEFPLYGSLIDTFVQRPVPDDAGWWSTRGMHLLGRPDVAVRRDGFDNDRDPVRLLDAYCLYLCAEAAADGVADGHTFRMTPSSPRFDLRHAEDQRHSSDDMCHNALGVWELHAS